jgi:hypothetical protein
MNIPKSISAKKTFEYRNFSFENAYPLIEPIKEDMIVAGTVSTKLLRILGDNFLKACIKPSNEVLDGNSHMRETDTSVKGLRLAASAI